MLVAGDSQPPQRNSMTDHRRMVQKLRRQRRRRPADLLTSIENLLDEIDQRLDAKLHRVLSSHVFVGYLDRQFALVQHNTKLYLVNYHVLRLQRHTSRFIFAHDYPHAIISATYLHVYTTSKFPE